MRARGLMRNRPVLGGNTKGVKAVTAQPDPGSGWIKGLNCKCV